MSKGFRGLVISAIAVFLCYGNVSAQKTDNNRKQQIVNAGIGIGVMWGSGLNISLNAEYMRQFNKGFYWGIQLSPQILSGGLGGVHDPNSYDPADHFEFNTTYLSGLVRYRLPLARKWLFLDMGLGAGISYNRMKEESRNVGHKDIVRPQLSLDLYLTFSTKKGFEIRISPFVPLNILLVSIYNIEYQIPSSVRFSLMPPWPGEKDAVNYQTEYISLSFGFRF